MIPCRSSKPPKSMDKKFTLTTKRQWIRMFQSLRFGPGPKSPNFRSGFFCLKKFLPGKHVEKPEGMELIPIKRRFIKNLLRKYNIPKSEQFVKFFCRIRINLKALTEKFSGPSGRKKTEPRIQRSSGQGRVVKKRFPLRPLPCSRRSCQSL